MAKVNEILKQIDELDYFDQGRELTSKLAGVSSTVQNGAQSLVSTLSGFTPSGLVGKAVNYAAGKIVAPPSEAVSKLGDFRSLMRLYLSNGLTPTEIKQIQVIVAKAKNKAKAKGVLVKAVYNREQRWYQFPLMQRGTVIVKPIKALSKYEGDKLVGLCKRLNIAPEDYVLTQYALERKF